MVPTIAGTSMTRWPTGWLMDPFLLLAAAEGCGPLCIAALLDPDLDPTTVPEALDQVQLPPAVRARLHDRHALEQQARDWQRDANRNQAMLWTPTHEDYPKRLLSTPLRPLVLFAQGEPAALHSRHIHLAIVGSRTPTPYGEAATRDFATVLSRAGVILWSGLAAGVDGIAHRCAIENHTPTIAVVAGGLDRIYPRHHEPLARSIRQHGGIIMTEAPFGRRALRGHFPRRNRILGQAVDAVLVVEAGLASGTMYTARFAAEVGVPVFAVPGSYTSSRSRGCHDLIAEGAQIARDPEDLLRRLDVEVGHGVTRAMPMDADQTAILQILQQGPRPGDLVQRESRLQGDRYVAALMALLEAGRVQLLPGDLLAPMR